MAQRCQVWTHFCYHYFSRYLFWRKSYGIQTICSPNENGHGVPLLAASPVVIRSWLPSQYSSLFRSKAKFLVTNSLASHAPSVVLAGGCPSRSSNWVFEPQTFFFRLCECFWFEWRTFSERWNVQVTGHVVVGPILDVVKNFFEEHLDIYFKAGILESGLLSDSWTKHVECFHENLYFLIVMHMSFIFPRSFTIRITSNIWLKCFCLYTL